MPAPTAPCARRSPRCPTAAGPPRIEADGFDEHVTTIAVTVTVSGDTMLLDFAGSSPQIDRGINCVMNYTHAYAVYPVKCALDPFTPRNEGSYRAIEVRAPEGSILNPRFPAPVSARQLTGHLLAGAIYQAMSPVIPGQVIAECGGAPTMRALFSGLDRQGDRFSQVLFASGGMGASPHRDGLATTAFPTNAGAGSIEAFESVAPLVVWAKQLRPDSGGAGQFRGGLGQEAVIEVRSPAPLRLSLLSDRREHPAQGVLGGGPGGAAEIVMSDGTRPHPKSRTTIDPGTQLVMRYAGGGGYGPASARDPAALAADLRDGYVDRRRALWGALRWPGTARIGVDVGGTFTDLVLHDPQRDMVHTGKLLTTPDDPSRAIIEGTQRILREAGLAPADLHSIVHGTTLVTNTVIERTGARVGLLTTAGFRDAIEIGKEIRYDLYDLFLEAPPTLVPRHLRPRDPRPARCRWRRAAGAGRDRRRPRGHRPGRGRADRGAGDRLPAQLPRSAGTRGARGRSSAALYPKLALTLSAEVAPEIREYERSSTACANAYVQPRMRRYLDRLEADLAGIGFEGRLYVMLSGGGIAAVREAKEFPIRLIECGPAAGAMAAAFLARLAGLDRVVSFDMGGTTAKMCLVEDGAPGS